MSPSPKPGDTKCVEGAEYIWMSKAAAGNDLTSINDKLSQIIDILVGMGGGGLGGGGVGGAACGTCNGEYVSLLRHVDPKKTDEEIIIGIASRHIHLRTDQTIKLKLGGTMADEILIDATESPFEIHDIGGVGYDTVYVTTGEDTTTVKILAYN